MFRHSPAYVAAAVLTLALGIGLSTAVFTIGDALIIKRLPVAEQQRLLVLSGQSSDGKFPDYPLPLAEVREFHRRSNTLSDVAFFAFRGATPIAVRDADRVYQLLASLVSGNFFDVARVEPVLGRSLRPEDDLVGASPSLVISYRTWKERFGGDPLVLGKNIALVSSGRSFQIVGVMPEGLDYPNGADMWFPLVAYSAAGGFLEIASGELDMLVRLKPSASLNQTREELNAFLHRSDAPAAMRDLNAVARPLQEVVLGNTKSAVVAVMITAFLLLLITCANVANLALLRALGRAREFAVRSALGATRSRQIAQLLTEGAALAVAGGVIGFVVAVMGVKLFVHFAPGNLPRIELVAVNMRALIAALFVTTFAMLLSSVGPAVIAARTNNNDSLRSGSRMSGARGTRRLAELLVVVQIAFAAVSLTAAALVTRSFIKLNQLDLSFNPQSLYVASLGIDQAKLPDANRQRLALAQLLDAMRVLPGVKGVSPTFAVPFVGAAGGIDARLSRPGQSLSEAATNPILNMEIVAPDYFGVLGVSVTRGRAFNETDRDGSEPVAIVSNSVAERFWPGEDAIGKRVQSGKRQYVVVGQVPDTRYRELENARASVYFPMNQSPLVPANILVRTNGSNAGVVASLRNATSQAGVGIELVTAAPLEELISIPRSKPRLNTVMLLVFAGSALLLTAVGLFAVISTMVRMRTHEFGVRMALGATAGRVFRLILSRAVAIAIVGTVVGLAAAFAGARLMGALLFEVSPNDPWTFMIVAATIVVVAILSGVAPALAGLNVEPSIALRSET